MVIVLIVIISIGILGCSSGDSEPSSIELNAKVGTKGGYLVIENEDEFVWDNAKLTINDDYVYKVDFLAKGKSSLELVEFTKKDGERFNPITQKILKIVIYVPKTEDRKDGFWFGEFK